MTNDEIKEWLHNNSMTQAQIAESLGYSRESVCSALSGRMSQKMHDAIMRFIEIRSKGELRVPVSDEKKRELLARAQQLGKDVEQLILDALSNAIGEDLSQYKEDIRLKNWEGYPIDDEEGEDPTALQASEDKKS